MSTTSPAGVLACSIALPVLGISVVGLRFFTRMGQKADLQFDDWVQIPALVRSDPLISCSVNFVLATQAERSL